MQSYVTRGVHQGSINSPFLFNIYINDMLKAVSTNDNGVTIGDVPYSIFGYADDVTLFSSTVKGLQSSIDICVNYAKEWRFNFNSKKSKCMTIGPNLFHSTPCWYLGDTPLEVTDSLDILGFKFTSAISSNSHIERRINACRQSVYGLSNIGLSYPRLPTDAKTYLWNTVCVPILRYGLDSCNVTAAGLK